MSIAVIIKAGTLEPSTNRAVYSHLTNKCNQRREKRKYFRDRSENGSVERNKVYKVKQYRVLGLTARTA